MQPMCRMCNPNCKDEVCSQMPLIRGVDPDPIAFLLRHAMAYRVMFVDQVRALLIAGTAGDLFAAKEYALGQLVQISIAPIDPADHPNVLALARCIIDAYSKFVSRSRAVLSIYMTAARALKCPRISGEVQDIETRWYLMQDRFDMLAELVIDRVNYRAPSEFDPECDVCGWCYLNYGDRADPSESDGYEASDSE